jgi:hypothetical protein
MEIITLTIIFSFIGNVSHIDYYFPNTSQAFISNETLISNDFIIDRGKVIKVTSGEFTSVLSPVHNDVPFWESFEDLAKIVTTQLIFYPIINDPIMYKEGVFRTEITDAYAISGSNTYRPSYFENDVRHLWEENIYKISKSTEVEEKALQDNVGWINLDQASLSILIERNEPVSGSASLRVDVQPAVVADDNDNANVSWSGITSDFIPIRNDTYYSYSLDVSSKNVDQLHSIVSYYDSNKTQIKEDYIFGGNDGTFKKEFNNSFLTPLDAKYAKVQMWLKPNIGKPSSYLIDNIRIAETTR